MLKILREPDDPGLMEQIWSFRHRKFVEEMGWEELRHSDQRERDSYDTADTYHVVLVADKRVVAYSRLLPTTLPHLTKRFCEEVAVKTPSGPSVFEWSRCATADDAPLINGRSASDLLMTGVLECLLELEAQTVIFLTYQSVIKMMRRRGYPIKNLCSITLPNGDRVEAVTSALSIDILDRHRRKHKVAVSLLEWGPSAISLRIEPSTAA